MLAIFVMSSGVIPIDASSQAEITRLGLPMAQFGLREAAMLPYRR